MAPNATICKAALHIADVDRQYYEDHSITLARHPSETDERMMVRLLAFALYADAALTFGKGLGTDDEPDLWRKDLSGAIECWIDVGQPDEKWVRKACGRAAEVIIVVYGRASEVWWQGIREKLARHVHLRVIELARADTTALAALAQRSMRLQCTVQDGQAWITNGTDSVHLEPRLLLGAEER